VALEVCDNCAEAGEPGYGHSEEWHVLRTSARIEQKLDQLLELLELYRPLLEEASKRLGKGPRWRGGTRGTTNQSGAGTDDG